MYYTAKEFGQRPSYYAFGDKIQLQSQYEIDLYILAIGKAHEAALADAADEGTSGDPIDGKHSF